MLAYILWGAGPGGLCLWLVAFSRIFGINAKVACNLKARYQERRLVYLASNLD